VRSGSQDRIQNRVDVHPQPRRVNQRKSTSARDQVPRRHSSATKWSQFGDFRSIPSDNHRFARGHPGEDIAPMVTQVAHCYRIHIAIVSPVRQPHDGQIEGVDNWCRSPIQVTPLSEVFIRTFLIVFGVLIAIAAIAHR
jgi:hypothetical protein